jgi:hypothetical protein
MTGSVSPFQAANVISISASTTSASAALPPGGDEVLITNACADYVFIAFSGVATSAPPCSVIPAGQRRLFSAPPTVTTISVLANSGTGTVFVERGSGTAY